MANSYLNRNITSSGNAKTWTWSYWVKRAKLGSWMNTHNLGGTANRDYGAFDSSNRLEFAHYNSGYQYRFLTNRVFRDVSAWYHIVIAMDTTQSTESNRTKIYVNGVQETSFNTATYPSQNQNTRGSQDKIMVGADFDPGNYFDGYQSHVAFVDGQALAPTVFGETDSTSGIWKFKSPSGVTWGTNGFHLKFENSGNLGLDSSGNSNTFTVNGNGRQALDTPSNVYSTFNPLFKSNSLPTGGLSNGNNTAKTNGADSTWRSAFSSIATPPSGKYYFEVKWSSGSHFIMGAASAPTLSKNNFKDLTDASYSGQYICLYGSNWYSNGSNQSTYQSGISLASGVIGMMALDRDNNKIWFGVNGSWGGSQNPATNTGGQSLPGDLDEFWNFGISSYSNSGTGEYQANFGNGYFGTTAITSAGSNGNGSLFEYDVPSGYYALNTKNINTYG